MPENAAGGVFGEASITDLAITKDLANIPEVMCNFDTNTTIDFLGLQFFGIHFLPG